MPDTPLPDPAAQSNTGDTSIFGPRHVTRLLIVIMTVISCAIFVYSARFVHWPSERGFRGSMAQPPLATTSFLVALAMLIVCTIIGTMMLRHRYFLAGLMVATAGLTTWSVRGGTSTYVLFNAQNTGAGPRVFLELLGELVALFAVIGGLWNAIWVAYGIADAEARRGMQRKENLGDAVAIRAVTRSMGSLGLLVWLGVASFKSDKEESKSTFAAIIAQTALMAVFILIFVATPQKKQVLVGVFIAAIISTALADSIFADRKASRWYWVGPFMVGGLGYLVSYFFPAGLEQGDLTGMFGPLARVLPLDYASVGCAGALMGYWWMIPDEVDDSEENTEAPK